MFKNRKRISPSTSRRPSIITFFVRKRLCDSIYVIGHCRRLHRTCSALKPRHLIVSSLAILLQTLILIQIFLIAEQRILYYVDRILFPFQIEYFLWLCNCSKLSMNCCNLVKTDLRFFCLVFIS